MDDAMRDAYLDHLSFALGDSVRTVEQTAALGLLRSSVAALRDAGFSSHCIASPGTTAYDLALRAVAPLRGRLSGIDAIIYATTLPCNGNVGDERRFRDTGDVKYLMDFPASHLQADLELTGAQVIGLNQQACTGFLGAVRVAHCLLAGEPGLSRVLCITADRFPRGALYEQAYNLISDGAAACIVQREPEPTSFRMLASHAITNGAMSFAGDDETMGLFFTYTHRLVQETLAKARLGMNDVRWLVTQNTNNAAWRVLSSLLRIDFERVCFPTLGDVGHMISGDNVVNLMNMLDRGLVARGDKLMLVMAGYGLNWQSVVLEKE
jgi:3-oxoacyl-[acyl-carrier-protein] synthase-3